MIAATSFAVSDGFSPLVAIHIGAFTLVGFIAVYAVLINLAVAFGATLLLRVRPPEIEPA